MSKQEIKHFELQVVGVPTVKLSYRELLELRDVISEMFPPGQLPLTTYPVISRVTSGRKYWSDPIITKDGICRIVCD